MSDMFNEISKEEQESLTVEFKETMDKILYDNFALYLGTIALATVSFQQDNPREFAQAIVEGWKINTEAEKENYIPKGLQEDDLLTKEMILPAYKKVFGESLEDVAKTMSEAFAAFPEEKQDIRKFFVSTKPKE